MNIIDSGFVIAENDINISSIDIVDANNFDYVLLNANSGKLYYNNLTIPQDGNLFRFIKEESESNLSIYKTVTDIQVLGIEKGSSDADIYNSLFSGINSSKDKELITLLNSTLSKEMFKSSLQTMRPSLPSTSISSINTMNSSLSVLKEHLSIKTKKGIEGDNIWIQGYNTTAKQNSVDKRDGFRLDGKGFLVGYDTKIDVNSKYGIAFSYGTNTLTSSNSVSKQQILSKQNQLYLYFAKNFKDTYTQLYFTKGFSENSGSRDIYLGDSTREATSSYNSSLSNLALSSGLKYRWNGLKIVPNISLSSSISSTDIYQESGAGDLDLSVSNKDLYKSTILIGSSFSTKMGFWSNIFLPELKLGYRKDFGDTHSKATAKFRNSSYTFSTQGVEMDDTMLTYGIALKYLNRSTPIEIRTDFDTVKSKHFNSNTLSFTLRYLFK